MNPPESALNTDPHIDSDAVLWNLPSEDRPGKPLLIMMHGLGSHEGDFWD